MCELAQQALHTSFVPCTAIASGCPRKEDTNSRALPSLPSPRAPHPTIRAQGAQKRAARCSSAKLGRSAASTRLWSVVPGVGQVAAAGEAGHLAPTWRNLAGAWPELVNELGRTSAPTATCEQFSRFGPTLDLAQSDGGDIWDPPSLNDRTLASTGCSNAAGVTLLAD